MMMKVILICLRKYGTSMDSNVPDLERAVVEVFGGCNYKCQMCPQTTGRGKDWTRKMPFDMFEDILDQLPGKPVINLEGSGEPTMAKDLPRYIEACTKRGLPSFMYSNGSFFSGHFMQDCIDAGLSFARFSCIGYDKEKYKEWMSIDNFELLKTNIIKAKQYIKETNSKCEISSYHLILDNNQIEYEVDQYRNNFIGPTGTIGYIWKMHNWSGNYQPLYVRDPSKRRTCGRPFAPEITIRSGGIAGLKGAVTPCCQTMGPPNESKSVLGHIETTSIEDIWYGDAYNKLRKDHEMGDFPDYCQGCDFLYEDPEVLVWSNDKKASTDHMLGTNFSLRDFMIDKK
jgi:MoaA/NifB/PqqE/SkfB family radical SAM enzyme